jgi:glycosyltransferase involved in cell wall biosynthesis
MPIRVFHVITTLGRGGAERQLVNLACNTDTKEFEHIICYLHGPGDFAKELEAAGHKVYCLDLAKRWPWLLSPFRLRPYLKRLKPDIIQTWLFDADLAARLSSVGTGIPIIGTLHLTTYEPETIAAGGWPSWKMPVVRLLDRITAKLTKPLFIAVSETVRKSAIKQLGVPASQVRVIYNSINQDTLRTSPGDSSQIRHELEIPKDSFVYVNVGRLDPQKGQAYLLHAFKEVAIDHPDMYLAFVGEGMLNNELQELARTLEIKQRVKFLGRRNDVGACLEIGDAFVFPSLFEGLPLAPIEAMLKGVPCIATRIGPVQEIMTDRENALLVAQGSVPELAAAMRELYSNPGLRQQLADRAKTIAFERFDSGLGLRAWENLYREIAGKNRRDAE